MPPKKKRSASLPPPSRVTRTAGPATRSRSRSLTKPGQAPGAQPPIQPGPAQGLVIPAFTSKRQIADQAGPSAEPPVADNGNGPISTGLFGSDVGLGEKAKAEFFGHVKGILDTRKYSLDTVRELQRHAEFVADMADTVTEAVERWRPYLDRMNKVEAAAAIRRQWAEQGRSPNDMILAQLATEGHKPGAIVDKLIRPFVSDIGHLPGTMAADADRIMKTVFDGKTGVLQQLIPDTLLADMFDSRTQVQSCVEAVNRIRAFMVDQMDVAGYYDATVQEIPHRLDFYWSGRPISEDALANISAWAKKCQGTDWTVTLWTDPPVSDWTTRNTRKRLQAAGVTFADARPHIDSRLSSAYKTALQNNSVASASDFFRWSRFRKTGGVYVDVDIAPGQVDLTTLSHQANQLSAPLYGPGLRDLSTVRALLGMQDGELVTAEHVDKAVEIQRKQGVINSNFIVLPTGSMYVDPMINEMARKTKSMQPEDWRTAGGMVAGITGPTLLMGVTGDINAIKEKVTPQQGFDLIRQEYVCPWPLVWLTPESENQDWSLGKKKTDKK